MSHAQTFPTGSTVVIPGLPPFVVGRYLDQMPGVELTRDGEHILTVNPKYLMDVAKSGRRAAA